jgi:metal-responsive CopG/Arc/MetJ family transcriptional regulator
MTATIPLRLPQEYLDQADNVIEERYGAGSRNSVLREMIARGFEAYFAERKGKK